MFEAIFLLVIGAIWAAGKGDWSGIEMILKGVLYIGVFLLFGLMITTPAGFMLLGIIVLCIIAVCCSDNK